MDPIIGGALIGAGASLAGGGLASASNKKEGKRQWRRTKVLNQNQIQWRVKDAQAAGIHPLAALGMSPIGNAMSSTGSVMGDALQNAGSQIGQGVAQYGQAKQARRLNALAETESAARTNLLVAQAREAQSQAEYTDQLRANSIVGMFKSPGRAGYVSQGAVALPDPMGPPTPISQAHAQALDDVTPGSATSTEPTTIKGAGGLNWRVNKKNTPGGILEETGGEPYGLIALWNLLHEAGDADIDPEYKTWWLRDMFRGRERFDYDWEMFNQRMKERYKK